MRRALLPAALAVLVASAVPCQVRADDAPAFTRTRDVIYGRHAGLALTMDVFAPKKDANGAAVIYVVSGGWFSNPDMISPAFAVPFTKRGYTVFAVVHGTQPKFTIPEILDDMNRSVRFIRSHAKDYQIDPDRIGIMGGSAGGHLSLMQGTAGGDGNPKADDPVERASSRVQAVACFFPPTDFLNWGAKGKEMIDPHDFRKPFGAALDFREFDKDQCLIVPVTDKDKRREICKRISPVYHVAADSPPTLIMHGDKDDLVPIQQSEEIMAKFREAGVEAKLIVKKGEGHGLWLSIAEDLDTFADWFDAHLPKKKDKGD
jgi:acetyl esterase/lipase